MSKDEDKSRQAANEQLRPCPFCGGKAHVNDHIYFEVPPTYGIVCGECGSMSRQFYDTMGEAVAAWNTRKEDSDYCGYCGADMRKVTKNE